MAQNDSNPTPPQEPHVVVVVAVEPIIEDLVQDKEEENDSSKIVIPILENESLSLKEVAIGFLILRKMPLMS